MTNPPSFVRFSTLSALLVAVLLVMLPSGAVAETEQPTTPAEHYAGLLAEQPEGTAVVVDDAVGGAVPPEEMTEELHEIFGDAGVPYYVVVTPFLGAGTDIGIQEIASALHDRLGANGMYVVLTPEGRELEVETYGVEADSSTVIGAVHADPDLAYDAPATEVAQVIAAAVADPAVTEELRAEKMERERFGPLSVDARAELHPSHREGPQKLGYLAGAVGGTVVVVGLWGAWQLRRRDRGHLATAVGLGAALVAVAAVTGPVSWVANAPTGEHEKPDPEEVARTEEPYVISTARVEHIAARLAEDPLYVDPLVQLPRESLDGVGETLADAPVPVYAAVVPLEISDEVEGDQEVLAAALAATSEREGVYLVAGSGIGDDTAVGAAAYGFGTDFSFDFTLQRIDGPNPADVLRQAVAELDQVELTPGGEYTPRFTDEEPSTPAPRMERYWGEGVVPGFLMFGLLGGAAVIGVTWLLIHALQSRRGSGRVVDERVLRRLATKETRQLRELLARREGDLPEELLPQADAALLVMDAKPSTLDLLGVVVLARRVRAEADDPAATGRGPCAVSPLHPWATEQGQSWEGKTNQANLCADCAALETGARATRKLRLSSGGTGYPYDSAQHSPWIRHRFGVDGPLSMAEELLKEHHVS